jgi:uncharacterized protein
MEMTMRIVIFVGVFLASSLAVAQSLGGTPFIAVHGRATVDVVPDLFPVTVVVSETNLDTAKAQGTVEKLTADVLGKIRALSVKDEDVAIGNVRIEPVTNYDKADKEVFQGNRYSRVIEVKFHSLDDLKAFVAGVPAGKQVSVSTEAFVSSSINDIRRRLLADAMADARKTANVVSSTMNQRIVRIQTVSDRPLSLQVGSYINSIDAYSVESTTILTSDQIARIPVPRNITSVALLSPGTLKSSIVLEKGTVSLSTDVYVVYLLGD